MSKAGRAPAGMYFLADKKGLQFAANDLYLAPHYSRPTFSIPFSEYSNC